MSRLGRGAKRQGCCHDATLLSCWRRLLLLLGRLGLLRQRLGLLGLLGLACIIACAADTSQQSQVAERWPTKRSDRHLKQAAQLSINVPAAAN